MQLEDYGEWVVMGARMAQRIRLGHELTEWVLAEELTPEMVNANVARVGADRWIMEYRVNGNFISWSDVPDTLKHKLEIAHERWSAKTASKGIK
jgi:hypothetical protein